MGRSAKYRSPEKIRRSYLRLISHLIKMNKNCERPRILTESGSRSLNTSKPVLTNYPEACTVCQFNQCETDLCHTLHFTISKTMDESFAKHFPDVFPMDVKSLLMILSSCRVQWFPRSPKTKDLCMHQVPFKKGVIPLKYIICIDNETINK